MGRIVNTGTFAEPELVRPTPTIEQDVREWQAPIPLATHLRIGLISEGPQIIMELVHRSYVTVTGVVMASWSW
jgi:hypothetical protein